MSNSTKESGTTKSGRKRFLGYLLGVLMLLALVVNFGFGGRGRREARVPVYQTRGKVSFQGNPAAGALVLLHPLDQGKPLPFNPRARVGEDGTFLLTTYDDNDGAPAGEYAVTIDWRETESEDGAEEGVNLIDPRFNDPDTSGIRVRIESTPGGTNELQEIRLTR